jgi:diguanylate cyclase (GGDEF)-like protein
MNYTCLVLGLNSKDKTVLEKEITKDGGCSLIEVQSPNELKNYIETGDVHFVFAHKEYFPLDMHGDLLTDAKLQYPMLSFVIIGKKEIDAAIDYVKKGADYYLSTPLKPVDVRKILAQAGNPSKGIVSHFKKETTLFQIIKQISLTMELDPLLNLVIDSSMELSTASMAVLLLYDSENDLLTVHSMRGISKEETETGILHFSESYLKGLLKTCKPVFLSEKEYQVFPERNPYYKSVILSPIASSIGGYGLVITAKQADEDGDFSLDEVRSVSSLASEIAPAVRNSLLHNKTRELTIKDDLTDAYNRRFFEKYLHDEIEKAKKFQTTISLIFLDIDNLKEINEKHGHLMGSKVLQEVAHRIILAVRGIDKVIRYGGDEFCIILPETDTSGACLVAERIKHTIANKPFLMAESLESHLTASFGIASFPQHASNKDEMIKKADRAMFEIKSAHKNDIKIAD